MQPAKSINHPSAFTLGIHSLRVGNNLNLIRHILSHGLLSPNFAARARALGRKNIPVLRPSSEEGSPSHVYFYGADASARGHAHILTQIGLAYGDVGFLIDSTRIKQQYLGRKVLIDHPIQRVPRRISPNAIAGVVVDQTHTSPRRMAKLTQLCRTYEVPLYVYRGPTYRDGGGAHFSNNLPVDLIYDPYVDLQKQRQKIVTLLRRRGTNKVASHTKRKIT